MNGVIVNVIVMFVFYLFFFLFLSKPRLKFPLEDKVYIYKNSGVFFKLTCFNPNRAGTEFT